MSDECFKNIRNCLKRAKLEPVLTKIREDEASNPITTLNDLQALFVLNGNWFHGTTSTGGTAGTRNGRVIDFGVSATFDETSAFVDGLVPYGDIP